MEILVKQGRWLVNGKSTDELTKKEFDSLNNHLSYIRQDYYLHHGTNNRKLSIDEHDGFVYFFKVISIIVFGFAIVYSFIKFVVNQK